MKEGILRKRIRLSDRKQTAAQGEEHSPGGCHFGDYRPRYQECFDIYEKAKKHARDQKKNNSKKDEKSC